MRITFESPPGSVCVSSSTTCTSVLLPFTSRPNVRVVVRIVVVSTCSVSFSMLWKGSKCPSEPRISTDRSSSVRLPFWLWLSMIRSEFTLLPFRLVVDVHDLVGSSAVWESDVCANTPGQKLYEPIMTSTQPKATTHEALQRSADGRATDADRTKVSQAAMSIDHPPNAFGFGDFLLCHRPAPSSYVDD